ncbi:hypothetical protein M409DRAFT_19738 [Zasmidium cellare ATCC 36951]|uniref:F-box domain-containing protein n=1 Tax=Zasmidium cellare ATCC 36951 TaxID=1080233 RepID=A0A6A6CTT9_ZASCE|nr:uncharacterized protein M409DRAFT_19738 [Zasmidium cellare ATCC 36951]KAF2170133.1 hypothetical protein M409DRAFT_19738 [Zasmidium cellare ATCC 36951]
MCPPGTDQTTRGPQRWHLLAPSLKQSFRPFQSTGWSERNFSDLSLSDLKNTTFAFRKLSRLNVTSSGVGEGPIPSKKQLSPIEDLPAELLALINRSLGETDILALGACSRTLWMHALQHIQADHRKSIAAWAGTPLIFTGSYLTTLPSTLYEKFPYLQQEEIEYDSRQRFDMGRGCPANGMCPARRWNWDAVSSYEAVDGKTCHEKWRSTLLTVPDLEQKTLQRLHGDLDKVFRASVDGRWFLRNLTLKQFVKLYVSGTNAPGQLQVNVSGSPWLSLDMALLVRTRWSTPGTISYEKEGEETGAWAGHCFDVVQEQPEDEDWEDATVAVRDAAREIVEKKQSSESNPLRAIV